TNGKWRSQLVRVKIAGHFDHGSSTDGRPARTKDTEAKGRQTVDNEREHSPREVYISLDVEEIVGNVKDRRAIVAVRTGRSRKGHRNIQNPRVACADENCFSISRRGCTRQ